MREWEFHQARLHHKDSAKFTKPTPRHASAPFGEEHPVIGLSLVITFACIVGIIVVLFFAKGIV